MLAAMNRIYTIDAFLLILELVANMFHKCWATCCENAANKLNNRTFYLRYKLDVSRKHVSELFQKQV